jgi:hypothetical protein
MEVAETIFALRSVERGDLVGWPSLYVLDRGWDDVFYNLDVDFIWCLDEPPENLPRTAPRMSGAPLNQIEPSSHPSSRPPYEPCAIYNHRWCFPFEAPV